MSEKSAITVKGYDNLVGNVSQILEMGRRQAVWSLNTIMSAVYWEIGRQIVEFEQSGRTRAGYGENELSSSFRLI